MDECLIGIDIGTTSICGVAIDAGGQLIASVERPNDSAVVGLRPGRFEQAPARIRERAVEVLRCLREKAEAVAAIGLTGQMHGMLCVDGDREAVGNLVTWQDGRCLERAASGETWLEEIRRRVPADRWTACGCEPAGGFLGSTLYWMSRNDALAGATRRVCFVHDWIAAQLAGQAPVTDPSDAGSAGVFDLARMRWHTDIVHELALPEALLPPVRESGQVIGKLCAAMAEATDLPAGTPICNAIGDNQASVVGSIADMSRSVLVNLGTGGQISWAVDGFRREPGMETRYLPWGGGTLPAGFAGRFMLVGASLCGGRAYAWLNGAVAGWLNEFGVSIDRDRIYARLNELAAAAPADRGGLSVASTFAGTRADPGLRGTITGIGLDNFGLGNLARAVLAAIVDELCGMYDRAGGRIGCGHAKAVASGNAVRKNPLLAGLIGARTGCPVLIPSHREEAAFGAALMAGVGAGAWRDLDAAGCVIRYG